MASVEVINNQLEQWASSYTGPKFHPLLRKTIKAQYLIKRECLFCKRQYYADKVRIKHNRQTCCSRECSYKYRSKKISKPINVVCSTCNKPLVRAPSTATAKHGHLYCSPRCHYDGVVAGKTKRIVLKPHNISPEMREKMARNTREAAARRKAAGWKPPKRTKEMCQRMREATVKWLSRAKHKVSKIEGTVEKWLTQAGIEAIPQYALRSSDTGRYVACLDFFIPSTNTAIEVNGTFWHSDPRFFKGKPLKPCQLRNAKCYANKVKELDERGIKLVEVWEHDIRNNEDYARENMLTTLLEYRNAA